MMDTQEPKTYTRMESRWDRCRPTHSPYGKVLGGLVIVGVGVVLLAREMGVYFPHWVFTWPMLLIVIGFYVGAKHLFRNLAWLTLVIVGSLFLVDDIMPDFNLSDYFWPIMLIVLGLVVIFRPRRHHHWNKWDNVEDANIVSDLHATSEDRVDTVSVFGGVKKNIVSKDFKGGEVTCIFGGAEINLSQADINGRVELELTQIFGGTKLIVPPHWEIQPDMVAILGGVDDKRPVQREGGTTGTGKVLVLRGTTVFGGLDIRSY